MAAPFGPPWLPASLLPANPAAGATYTLTVPAGFFYHLLAVTVNLNTGVAVANRTFFATVREPTNRDIVYSLSEITQTASQSVAYTMALGYTAGLPLASGAVMMNLPDLVLPEGWLFVVNAAGLQVADQFVNIGIAYESLAYV